MKCVVVIAFCKADTIAATRLIKWIEELGGCLNNDLLIVDADDTGASIARSARFGSVTRIRLPLRLPNESHPRGPNLMFETALKYLHGIGNKSPILWLEPDAVPLRKGWLGEIEDEYARAKDAGKQILASISKQSDERFPKAIPSGVAVYPPNAWNIYEDLPMNREVAWDIQFADRIITKVYPSITIVNVVNHPSPPHFRSGGRSIDAIPKTAALWHQCKDDSLITALRDRFKPKRNVFYHSGDLGDILASLIVVRELGGGEFIIGPDNQTTMATREKMTPIRAASIIPLLESQPYIHSAQFSKTMPSTVTHDLNQMRNTMRVEYAKEKPWINLACIYLKSARLAMENDQKPWLNVHPKSVAPVVFARSTRYRDGSFDWKRIVHQYRGQSVFVGTKEEHEDFCKNFGRIPYHPTRTLLELAEVISGSKLFVGNQSCPYWIAEALKKPAILEVFHPIPNCMFKRAELIHGVNHKTQLPVIARSNPRKVLKGEPLVIRAPVDNFSGFGQFIKTIAIGLADRGHNVKIAPTQIADTKGFQPDIPPLSKRYQELFVDHSTPSQIIISMHCGLPHLIRGGEVVMTMWESTRINPETCDALNKASHVIVPSAWSATSFNACGVDTPISIVPLGIDTAIYKQRRWPSKKPFTFGCAGRIAHGGIRKGIDDVMEAFVRAFPNKETDVRLEVKCFNDCKVDNHGDDRIILRRNFMPDLVVWYAGLHCFVTASKGEGWGLQPHQAMACGRPVIAPRFSSLTEFFDDSAGWPVEFELKPAQGYYEGNGIWAEVNIDDLAEKMSYAFEHENEAIILGKQAAKKAAQFSNDHMIDRFEQALRRAGVL